MDFPRIDDAAHYILSRYKYKNDLLWGLLDHLINPNRLQAQLQYGKIAVPWQSFDCDKVASWFFATVRNHPTVEVARLVTLVCAMDPDPLHIFNQSNWGHHTICLVKLGDGACYGFGVNGLVPLADLSEATVDNHWSEVYRQRGYHYITFVDVPFPW